LREVHLPIAERLPAEQGRGPPVRGGPGSVTGLLGTASASLPGSAVAGRIRGSARVLYFDHVPPAVGLRAVEIRE